MFRINNIDQYSLNEKRICQQTLPIFVSPEYIAYFNFASNPSVWNVAITNDGRFVFIDDYKNGKLLIRFIFIIDLFYYYYLFLLS